MTTTADRSEISATEVGFAQLIRAEWTKFRTVRGWVIGLLLAAVLTVLLGLTVLEGPAPCGTATDCVPVGPGGQAVVDHFAVVQQSLTGDGSITVRVTSLSGRIPDFDAPEGPAPPPKPGLVPWAKAGVIIKAGDTQGATYAAVMVTGEHGVRMQDNFTNDVAGSQVSPAQPHWLRLTRAGDTVTGYESTDGTTWTQIGTAQLAGNPATVRAGMFVTSPDYEISTQQIGGTTSIGAQSDATATFDNVSLDGGAPGAEWTAMTIDGADPGGAGAGSGNAGPAGDGPARGVAAAPPAEQFTESAGTFTVTGSGDIAPAVAGPGGNTIERGLIGMFAGLVVVLVVGTSFITAEYRRGLIRTTLIASPRRGRVLAAKAVVIGAVTFVVGLVAALVAVEGITWLRRSQGGIVLPVSWLTELRVVAGTAVLLALAAVLALAVGTILRRSAVALAVVILLTVMPYLLAVASVLPAGPAQWLLRITPAAGFAITQSTPEYAQVDIAYFPSTGYFPLAPLAGLAVLGVWTALALLLANVQLQRRDA